MIIHWLTTIKMLTRIIRYLENNDIYTIIKDFGSIFIQQKTSKPVEVTDPHIYLKNYKLELIKGIGPKTSMKLANCGINNPYDLIKCQSIHGFSASKLNTWKQSALALD